MKKIVFISIVAMFVAVSANAQLFEYGLKAGVTFASLPMEEIQNIPTDIAGNTYNLLTGESANGYQAGIMTRVNIAMFFVQPEVYFNVSKATVQQTFSDGVTPAEMLDVQFQRFDIPLLVGVKVGPLRLKAGPVGTAVINSTGQLLDVVSQDLQSISDGLTWGFQAGASVDLFKKLAIEARYEGSLSKYADSFEIPSGESFDFDSRPRQFILSAGWWF